jgi:hypothetical protein
MLKALARGNEPSKPKLTEHQKREALDDGRDRRLAYEAGTRKNAMSKAEPPAEKAWYDDDDMRLARINEARDAYRAKFKNDTTLRSDDIVAILEGDTTDDDNIIALAMLELEGKSLMDCLILVDNSNIYIEGQKCSAIRKGIGPTHPGDRQPADISWRIDFSRLLTQLADGRNIRAAFLVGSRPPPNDEVWKMAERGGFKVIVHDRDAANKEKALDTELVVQGTLVIAKTKAPAVLVIGSRQIGISSPSSMSRTERVGPSKWPLSQVRLIQTDRWLFLSIRFGLSTAHLISLSIVRSNGQTGRKREF